MNNQTVSVPEVRTIAPEQIGALFVNDRGELINAKVELVTDPERGKVWRTWAAYHLPTEIFRDLGMVEADGSDEWLNVVEHNLFVAAASLTLARQLIQAGITINQSLVVRAAIVHDAAKRVDVETRGSREYEPYDYTLANVLLARGYSYAEVEAAKNTGRLADRYVADPAARKRLIAQKPLEATIIGYCDARTRESRIYTLEEAKNRSLTAKSKPADVEYLNNYWQPYYAVVERYLSEVCPDFDPKNLTNDQVFATIKSDSDVS